MKTEDRKLLTAVDIADLAMGNVVKMLEDRKDHRWREMADRRSEFCIPLQVELVPKGEVVSLYRKGETGLDLADKVAVKWKNQRKAKKPSKVSMSGNVVPLQHIYCARWSGANTAAPAMMKAGIPVELTRDQLEETLVWAIGRIGELETHG